jgi:hypothetical protein
LQGNFVYHCKKIFLKKIEPSFIPAFAWSAVTTVLLVLPGSSLPKETWFDNIAPDKWIHAFIFAVMVALWCWASLSIYTTAAQLKKAFILFAILWLVYGIAMEFVQKNFIPNRSFDVGDIIADGVGCVIGFLYSSKRYIKK